jgi:SAM-dependent methyltransferase
VTAVEPSAVMRAQRPADAAPCVDARAEALPFADLQFDVAMAVLSDHHWQDPLAGLREMARVAARVVVFQWDPVIAREYWLVRDYMSREYDELVAGTPTLAARAACIDAVIEPVPIPWDCEDGFFHAYWRRPEVYLDERVRRGTSVWSRVGEEAERRVVAALASDLGSGAWKDRNRDLLALEQADVGARLLVGGRQ